MGDGGSPYNELSEKLCNLYTTRKTADEGAARFGVEPPDIISFNAPDEVYPG